MSHMADLPHQTKSVHGCKGRQGQANVDEPHAGVLLVSGGFIHLSLYLS